MYSYEDRIRAVKLYIKLGESATATVRQLGYPNAKVLKAWYREYDQGQDLKLSRSRTWQKYSDEQKQVAVNHYLEHGHCLAGTVKARGYSCTETLRMWIKEIHPEMRHQVLGKAAVVQHAPELKQAAVIALCTRQVSAQAIAQKLAVNRPTLYNWKNQLLGRETASTIKCQNNSSPDSEQTELQRQVDRLRRDIRQLQLEHDLLK